MTGQKWDVSFPADNASIGREDDIDFDLMTLNNTEVLRLHYRNDNSNGGPSFSYIGIWNYLNNAKIEEIQIPEGWFYNNSALFSENGTQYISVVYGSEQRGTGSDQNETITVNLSTGKIVAQNSNCQLNTDLMAQSTINISGKNFLVIPTKGYGDCSLGISKTQGMALVDPMTLAVEKGWPFPANLPGFDTPYISSQVLLSNTPSSTQAFAAVNPDCSFASFDLMKGLANVVPSANLGLHACNPAFAYSNSNTAFFAVGEGPDLDPKTNTWLHYTDVYSQSGEWLVSLYERQDAFSKKDPDASEDQGFGSYTYLNGGLYKVLTAGDDSSPVHTDVTRLY